MFVVLCNFCACFAHRLVHSDAYIVSGTSHILMTKIPDRRKHLCHRYWLYVQSTSKTCFIYDGNPTVVNNIFISRRRFRASFESEHNAHDRQGNWRKSLFSIVFPRSKVILTTFVKLTRCRRLLWVRIINLRPVESPALLFSNFLALKKIAVHLTWQI